MLAGEAAAYVGKDRPNPDFDPCRPLPPRTRDMDSAARRALVQANPAYGRVICRCEDVTGGNSGRHPPGGGDFGRGQAPGGTGAGPVPGQLVYDQVLDLLARTLGVSPQEITQDGADSLLLGGEGT